MQILICQNLRNNLQHPNEYIRGVTLRFLCRIREEEIFEPLIPSILTCLEHRHSYVRRNAVLAINCIYKLPKGEMHLQDAPDLIEKVLTSEQDLSTKRNAFLMLCNHAQDRAVHYLLSQVDNVAHWGDILQIAVLELIRKVRLDSGQADPGAACMYSVHSMPLLSICCCSIRFLLVSSPWLVTSFNYMYHFTSMSMPKTSSSFKGLKHWSIYLTDLECIPCGCG